MPANGKRKLFIGKQNKQPKVCLFDRFMQLMFHLRILSFGDIAELGYIF
jgi:hypothetical protein